MKLKNPAEVFVKSMDEESLFEVFENVEVKQEMSVDVELITKMWPDGAPVMKHFDRGLGLSTEYTFKTGQAVDLIYDHQENKTYWFDNGIWFRTSEDAEYLVEVLNPEE